MITPRRGCVMRITATSNAISTWYVLSVNVPNVLFPRRHCSPKSSERDERDGRHNFSNASVNGWRFVASEEVCAGAVTVLDVVTFIVMDDITVRRSSGRISTCRGK